MSAKPYDSFLLVSFGGPDGPDDVAPFIRNVLCGRDISSERLEQFCEPYMFFGGKSPINEQNRVLLAAIVDELSGTTGNGADLGLAVYWANLHWHPFLTDVLRQIADNGFSRTLAFVTSAYGSYSGCRQYRQTIEDARRQIGPQSPKVDKIRLFYNHPGFISAVCDRVVEAIGRISEPNKNETLAKTKLLFTAHSLPVTMASECPYEQQVRETCRLVVEQLEAGDEIDAAARRCLADWQLVFQSRSGPPGQAWLEPDVGDWLTAHSDTQSVLIVPVGFMSDHMEVIYDLDIEVQTVCDQHGIKMVRAGTVGTHTSFVRMIRELVEERLQDNPTRKSLGRDGPWSDDCPPGCCGGLN